MSSLSSPLLHRHRPETADVAQAAMDPAKGSLPPSLHPSGNFSPPTTDEAGAICKLPSCTASVTCEPSRYAENPKLAQEDEEEKQDMLSGRRPRLVWDGSGFLPGNADLGLGYHEREYRRMSSNPKDELCRFRCSLLWSGLDQSTPLRIIVSWTVAFMLAIAIPICYLAMVNTEESPLQQGHPFDHVVQTSEAVLAGISFACLSHNLRKHGLRRFLFLDQISLESLEVQSGYIEELNVCSVVQLIGFVICLHGAARITHRAQRIVSIVSQWHAISTCQNYEVTRQDSEATNSTSISWVDEADQLNGADYDNDLSSALNMYSTSSGAAKNDLAAFQMRQAFVWYIQHDQAGISLFGYILDRSFVYALASVELSLLLFILGLTIGIN